MQAITNTLQLAAMNRGQLMSTSISLLRLSILCLALAGCYVIAWSDRVSIDAKEGLIVVGDDEQEINPHEKPGKKKK
jgi:hypothetical protein